MRNIQAKTIVMKILTLEMNLIMNIMQCFRAIVRKLITIQKISNFYIKYKQASLILKKLNDRQKYYVKDIIKDEIVK